MPVQIASALAFWLAFQREKTAILWPLCMKPRSAPLVQHLRKGFLSRGHMRGRMARRSNIANMLSARGYKALISGL
jgi:hypothetical protein